MYNRINHDKVSYQQEQEFDFIEKPWRTDRLNFPYKMYEKFVLTIAAKRFISLG
jgi:hypothetical protein